MLNLDKSLRSQFYRLVHFRNSILEGYGNKLIWLVLVVISMVLLFSAAGVLFFFSGQSVFLGVVLFFFSSLCLGVCVYSLMKFSALSFLDKKISCWLEDDKNRGDSIKRYYHSHSNSSPSQELLSKNYYMNSLSFKDFDKKDLYRHLSHRLNSDKDKTVRSEEFVAWEEKIQDYLLAAEGFASLFLLELSQQLRNPGPNFKVFEKQLVYFLHYPFIYFLIRTGSYKPLIRDELGFKIPDNSADWITSNKNTFESFHDPRDSDYWHKIRYNRICQDILKCAEQAVGILPNEIISLITVYYQLDGERDYSLIRKTSAPIEDPEQFFIWYEVEGQFLNMQRKKL